MQKKIVGFGVAVAALVAATVVPAQAADNADVTVDLVMDNFAQVTVSTSSVTLTPNQANFDANSITNSSAVTVNVRTNDTSGATLSVKALNAAAGRAATTVIDKQDILLTGTPVTVGTVQGTFATPTAVTDVDQAFFATDGQTTDVSSTGTENVTVGITVKDLGFYNGATPGGSLATKTYSNALRFTAVPNPS